MTAWSNAVLNTVYNLVILQVYRDTPIIRQSDNFHYFKKGQNEMIFQKDYMQQFREADADGTVGLRGYMNFFQDMATNYMHNL